MSEEAIQARKSNQLLKEVNSQSVRKLKCVMG